MSRRPEAGFGLIILIGLIAISALFVSATSLAFVMNARAIQLEIDKVKAYYLAEAGVMQAMQDWRDSSNTLLNRRFSPIDTTSVTGNQNFRVSQCESDFALYTMSSANWANVGGAARRLRAWRITNISTGTTFVVTKARVTWSPAGTEELEDIRLNGNSVLSGGPIANGAEITLSGSPANRRRTSGQNWSGNNTYLQWTAAPSNPVTVTVEWTFSDDAATVYSRSHKVTFWSGTKSGSGPSIQNSFAITSTGEVDQTLLKTLRTFKAVVSATPMEIVDWDEREINQT